MIDLSSLTLQLKDKPVIVMGLGKSGHATCDALRNAHIPYLAWDDDAKKRDDAVAEGFVVGDPAKAEIKHISFVVLSPGIPLTHPKPHPLVERARAAGKDVICDIELFYKAKPLAKTIGITGTNGKSTTTALIGHVLKVAGKKVEVGGNIGTSALDLDDISGHDAIYVFEMSSYQLDLCVNFTPTVSILLNLSPDHIDRHGSMEGYANAKARILGGSGTAIIGIDDKWTLELAKKAREERRRQVIAISTQGNADIRVTEDGMLVDTTMGGERKIADLKECKTLQGQHNWQNAASAYAAARVFGIDEKTIIDAFKIFPGLAHRQNIVTTIGTVTYINDSKATNDPAAAVALRTYKNIYWIAGGKPKSGNYPDCEKYLENVRHAFLIGEAEEQMAAWLEKKEIAVTKCGTLKSALSKAHKMAQGESLPEATILLSPACASFDQFRNFEERGETFVKYVKMLMETGDRFGRPAANGGRG